MTYTPVAERTATHEYDARLTQPERTQHDEILEGIHPMPCTRCGGQAQFVAWRDPQSPVHGMAGIDGSYSDSYEIVCGRHARD